ncbi:pyrroline-5-carboxylate reductase 3 isoform X3 [Salmo salar]|uniref:Pyrroline-5-carboxylate reductase 3 n=1 Tax=Salmo salar TaxID=8030 RepID=A0A1S3KK23_SALSA|nr:pyrroline-5-carboxylate reductase 3 isoform X3 [Salmo salar]|eukprot:XP_013978679.1 PREDICTED: pyrroline-5-carboxylate reductase 3 isoform X3 [Salmo salar]
MAAMKKYFWDSEETEYMLKVLRELDIAKHLDGRKVRNLKLFKVAEKRMKQAGYHRSIDQIRHRWKVLKTSYYSWNNNQQTVKLTRFPQYATTMQSIMDESETWSRSHGTNSGPVRIRNRPKPTVHDEETEDSEEEATAAQSLHDHSTVDVIIKTDPETPPEMDSNLRIGFIGAGNMAYGIAKGVLQSGDVPPTNVKVSAPSARNFGRFQELGVAVTHSNAELVSSCDLVFVAVKPHLVTTILSEITDCVTRKHIIVSVAAGVTLATLQGVYLFAEALAEGAVKMGMPSALAHSIAAQTVLGAGQLLRDSGKHPAQLRSEVCTPGGTTIFGLHAMEQGGVRAATMTAVETATERARELGRKSAPTATENRK